MARSGGGRGARPARLAGGEAHARRFELDATSSPARRRSAGRPARARRAPGRGHLQAARNPTRGTFAPFALDGVLRHPHVTCRRHRFCTSRTPEPLLKFLERARRRACRGALRRRQRLRPRLRPRRGRGLRPRRLGQRPSRRWRTCTWRLARAGRSCWRIFGYIKNAGRAAWLFPRSSFWRYFSVVCASGAFCALFWWWV